ncbi:hypothetical protein J2Z21_000154 [Streptomyces griseochromogenes]|uniref:Uncharacterized protein n=1 Tax=Streptomyces griseochromogenes TaxID=68214 RepID=A0A1B1B1F0_9ACTN|nr:hypothetical protein [Streptomyces griseochromogenes]ANP52643.1 hypothetical protein AVL59_26680 [Streptomyces griseochromogenes]MBP2047232.1 hypothetical protein [Streptomyces griseochromogenes]
MTTYVITVPGTFATGVGDGARARLSRALGPADPHTTRMGYAEDLDVLNVNEDNTFTLRLTVHADTGPHAVEEAGRLADSALRGAGLDEGAAALGPAVITGIDSEAD